MSSDVNLKVLASKVQILVKGTESEWSGHVLFMATEQLPRCSPYYDSCNGWSMLRDGQPIIWQ